MNVQFILLFMYLFIYSLFMYLFIHYLFIYLLASRCVHIQLLAFELATHSEVLGTHSTYPTRLKSIIIIVYYEVW